jgi:hypothetical protein
MGGRKSNEKVEVIYTSGKSDMMGTYLGVFLKKF